MIYAADGSSSLARTNGLAVVWRLRLTSERADQRESKLVGEVEVCAKALPAAADWVSKHCLMTGSRFLSRILLLLDWVHGLLMCVASDVMVLSSIKIGAPASSEGT
jgi:hypothetical protein